MARYLSEAWFREVEAVTRPRPDDVRPDLVLEQIVTGSPDGQVRYQIVVIGDRAILEAGGPERAHLTFTGDYSTAAAIFRAELSTQAALMDGRIKVSGDVSRLADPPSTAIGLDPVPGSVRAATTY